MSRVRRWFSRISTFYIKLIVSVGLLILLFTFVDFSEVLGMLPTLNAAYVLLALLIFTVDRVLMAVKWNILLRTAGVAIPIVEVIKTYYVGNFMGYFLPPTVGVDAVRTWRLSRQGHPSERIVPTIIVERLLGFLLLSLFSLSALVTFTIFHIGIDISDLAWWNMALVVLAACVLLVLFSKRVRRTIHSFLTAGPLGSLMHLSIFSKLKKASDSFQQLRHRKGDIFFFSILTLVEICLVILSAYVTALALNLNIQFVLFIAVIPIITFLRRIPISIGGIGVVQGLFVALFSLASIAPAQSLALGIVEHALTFVAVSPGIILYLFEPAQAKPLDDTAPSVQPTQPGHA